MITVFNKLTYKNYIYLIGFQNTL